MRVDLKELGAYFDSTAAGATDGRANGMGASSASDVALLYDQVAAELLHLLAPAPGARLLDIGCGTGEILERIARACPDVTGIDLSAGMVKIVNDKGLRAVTYDGGTLPFEDGSFDGVILYQVLINLPSAAVARHVVGEAVRVLRKGGTLVVGAVPHPQWSGLPTHRMEWWVRAKRQARKIAGGQHVVPYYSYDYQFFAQVQDSLDVERLAFVRCRVPRGGWDTKYHALFTR